MHHRHEALARAVVLACRQRNLRVTTAESCTGGKVIAALTDIAGASDVVDRGYVTYSNEAKCEALGVPEGIIARNGAVSNETACAMAEGARQRSGADMAVSITGIARARRRQRGKTGRPRPFRLLGAWRPLCRVGQGIRRSGPFGSARAGNGTGAEDAAPGGQVCTGEMSHATGR